MDVKLGYRAASSWVKRIFANFECPKRTHDPRASTFASSVMIPPFGVRLCPSEDRLTMRTSASGISAVESRGGSSNLVKRT